MREIKLRGKQIDNGEWVYGGFMQTPEATFIVDYSVVVQKAKDGYPTVYDVVEVDPETVGQFTGLHDKNGKEIYFDSDIVKYTYTIENDVETREETIRGTVILDLGFTNSLCVKTKGGLVHHFTASENKCLEVIGNIYE